MPQDTISRVAARILQGMAYDRATFKDKVEEHVGGAYLEFYKATLAKKNGQTKWVTHWMTEVKTLLDRTLVAALIHSTKGFKDKRKAATEVLVALRQKDLSYRRAAEKIVKKDFKISNLPIPLDDQDTEAFWARVQTAVDTGLGN